MRALRHSLSDRSSLTSLFVPALLLGPLLAGCEGGDSTGGGGSGTTSDPNRELALAALGAETCDDTLDSIYEAATPPSSWSASNRGDVIKCAYDRTVSVEEMKAHFEDEGMPPVELSTAAYRFRLAYWTERDEGEPVLTSAVLYLPVSGRGSPAPLIVAGHGSVGIADKCAPSREDDEGFPRDFRTQVYALAGDGWPVIAPDFPGLGTEGAATWMFSPDEGHAMLDATRAARKLAKQGVFSDKNAIVGHSNGGHAALSAQSYAKAYGTDGTVDAVVVWAPFWLSNGAWGALITPVGNALITPAFLSMSMQYFYGHLYAYEGQDHVTDAFLPEKGAEIADFLEGGCWQDVARADKGPQDIGLKKGADAFTALYTGEVGQCGFNGTCDSDLAKTWNSRWAADRPPPDPSIPIVLWHGKKDDFLTPGFVMCGIDRLNGQGADLTVCIDEEGDHSTVLPDTATWVRGYLEEKLLGGAPPGGCTGLEVFDPPLTCSAPIPNSTDPAEP
ncbi:MAG: lipase family protein [Polyangiaceae bacterium]